MRRQEVSIEDIARAADVSHSTVSRALRNSSLISVEVRERIQKLAREMGYTPNAIAQSLQTQQSMTIGLVVTSIADPFWGDVMKGVEEVARAAGFGVFLSASHNDPDQEIAIIKTFHRRRVDGILVAASRITSNSQRPRCCTGFPWMIAGARNSRSNICYNSVIVQLAMLALAIGPDQTGTGSWGIRVRCKQPTCHLVTSG